MTTLLLERGVDPMQVQKHLEQVAGKIGLPFGKREKTYNTRIVQELGKWAGQKGKGALFHDAVFHAFFVDGKNIGKKSVLVALSRSLGLPENEAVEVLATGAFREAVDQDWTRSRIMGIKMAPTMVFNEKYLVGAQSYEKMVRFLKANPNLNPCAKNVKLFLREP